MKRILQILFVSVILVASLTSINNKNTLNRDALDTIRVYKNDSIVSKWTAFDSPKNINLRLNLASDTLTFLCSTDVGWMDSTSLTLTTNLESHNTLYLVPFIDSNVLKMHYKLPGTNIDPTLKNIQVWRNTSPSNRAVIFNIQLLE